MECEASDAVDQADAACCSCQWVQHPAKVEKSVTKSRMYREGMWVWHSRTRGCQSHELSAVGVPGGHVTYEAGAILGAATQTVSSAINISP